ncbi:peroxiredoxin Prx1p, mitochondrial [[Candida] jaroonii]|uniref:Peroxiredoxin Prx1p, mitochondrial n=1 Tax=[Candida] jaroonii TaxID=467808 RepID=A0ACA9Y4E5_9ASCO|nr:peroxiredoxin Prx1p, mitochondrial [[Candida] jaroonii]
MFRQLIKPRNLRIPTLANRFYSFDPSSQPRIRIGSEAPNFQIDTTKGKIDFHEFIGNDWVVFFSHPADFTPVCTTELGAFAQLEPEFKKLGAKLIGLSTEGVESHNEWIKDIEQYNSTNVNFPIIADENKEVAFKYDMLSEEQFQNINSGLVPTVRSVFVIDPLKKIRAMITYPPSLGRNSAEVLRIVEALQVADNNGVVTPIDWTTGKDVIIPPTVSDEAAKEKFGDFTKHFDYLRTLKLK